MKPTLLDYLRIQCTDITTGNGGTFLSDIKTANEPFDGFKAVTPVFKDCIALFYWCEEMYLEYFNDYLTVTKFAEHKELPETIAELIIEKGRYINHCRATSKEG